MKLIFILSILTFFSCNKCPDCTLTIQNTESFQYLVKVQGYPEFTMDPGAVEFVQISSDELINVHAEGSGSVFNQNFRCYGQCGFVRVFLSK